MDISDILVGLEGNMPTKMNHLPSTMFSPRHLAQKQAWASHTAQDATRAASFPRTPEPPLEGIGAVKSGGAVPNSYHPVKALKRLWQLDPIAEGEAGLALPTRWATASEPAARTIGETSS